MTIRLFVQRHVQCLRSSKNIKPRLLTLCEGNPLVNDGSPQKAFPCHDVIMLVYISMNFAHKGPIDNKSPPICHYLIAQLSYDLFGRVFCFNRYQTVTNVSQPCIPLNRPLLLTRTVRQLCITSGTTATDVPDRCANPHRPSALRCCSTAVTMNHSLLTWNGSSAVLATPLNYDIYRGFDDFGARNIYLEHG